VNLPDPYKRFHRTHLRFALIMIVVALLAGICFQESGRKVHISEAVPVGAHLEFIFSLALVHGHIFLVGVLIPLALTWMLQLTQTLGLGQVPDRTLAWGSALYIPGAILTVALMLIKGYHLVLGVRHGGVDFAKLDAAFLGGSHALRAAVYGASHLAMGAGLCLLAAGLWRTLKTR